MFQLLLKEAGEAFRHADIHPLTAYEECTYTYVPNPPSHPSRWSILSIKKTEGPPRLALCRHFFMPWWFPADKRINWILIPLAEAQKWERLPGVLDKQRLYLVNVDLWDCYNVLPRGKRESFSPDVSTLVPNLHLLYVFLYTSTRAAILSANAMLAHILWRTIYVDR